MAVTFDLGVGAIRSYKRLSYTLWHALGEFVDNATQNYFNNRDVLDAAYAQEGERLEVSIIYERDDDLVRIADNAMGMSLAELERALQVGVPPDNPSGRSEFGMGMKTAACWIGNEWTVRTKKLGEERELEVTVDVERVAAGDTDLALRETPKPADLHYTVIEIRRLHHRWHGRTLGKVKDHLRSMYRVDLRDGCMDLYWRGAPLDWEESDDRFVHAADGSVYKKPFDFEVAGKQAYGWVGVLERGSRSKAGFSIIRRGRVVRGWPDSWRPRSIFGQEGGSNDLINQRVTGEINLDEFVVSHTKDDILWMEDEEDQVETALREAAEDYVALARTRRKRGEDERGPSDVEIQTAIEEFQAELQSGTLIDSVEIDVVPPPDVVAESFEPLIRGIEATDPAFSAQLGDVLRVSGYLAMTASPNDPYVAVEAPTDEHIIVSINVSHPHWRQITGAEGVLNYFRECTYDALAEWKSRRAHQLEPHTVKMFKDRFLRVSMDIETHMPEPEPEPLAEELG